MASSPEYPPGSIYSEGGVEKLAAASAMSIESAKPHRQKQACSGVVFAGASTSGVSDRGPADRQKSERD
jgi:hypothetical protein